MTQMIEGCQLFQIDIIGNEKVVDFFTDSISIETPDGHQISFQAYFKDESHCDDFLTKVKEHLAHEGVELYEVRVSPVILSTFSKLCHCVGYTVAHNCPSCDGEGFIDDHVV